MECRDGAEWDADRKNCVVVDWEKYDRSIEDEKKKVEEEEKEEEEEKKAEELKKWEEERLAKKAKKDGFLKELEEKKEKLMKSLDDSEPVQDALLEEPVIDLDKDEL